MSLISKVHFSWFTFYINYEECKWDLIFDDGSEENCFILTMRNVNQSINTKIFLLI